VPQRMSLGFGPYYSCRRLFNAFSVTGFVGSSPRVGRCAADPGLKDVTALR